MSPGTPVPREDKVARGAPVPRDANNGDGRLRYRRLPRKPRAHAWRAAPEGLSGKVRCLSRPDGSGYSPKRAFSGVMGSVRT